MYINLFKKISIAHWVKKLERTLFPYLCVLCQSLSDTARDLCSQCIITFPKLKSACRQCANPLNANDLICGRCLKHPPAFDRTISAFAYAKPIDHLILQLKFRKKLMYADLLGELMAEAIKQHYPNNLFPECIIPVPLHIRRLRDRGFNQALELARPIAKKLNIPIDISLCERKRWTLPQMDLPITERKQNVRKAFSIMKKVSYQKVAILDDVMTTGRTVEELSKILKASGVQEVTVWCCARAIFLRK